MDTITRTCSTPGCDRKHQARGLCSTHYNQQHQPNRHMVKQVPCVVCGRSTTRSGGGGRIFGATCSTECRRRLTFGWSEPLPPDHMALHFGRSCEIAARECEWCGNAFTSRYPTALLCSDRCRGRRSRARRYGREAEAAGEYTWTEITRLWIAFDRTCCYCGAPTPLAHIQAEHVVPLSRGGRNDLSNLLPSCGPCNAVKGDQTPTEWEAERARKGKPPLRTHWNATNPLYRHLTPQDPTGTPHRARQAA